jgi:transcriptional regulator with XRE-family HTH domain
MINILSQEKKRGPGERIKKIRTELGLSQAAFGKRIGFSGRYVGNIEEGKAPASHRFMEAVAREFVVAFDWIETGAGTPHPGWFEELEAIMKKAGDRHYMTFQRLVEDIKLRKKLRDCLGERIFDIEDPSIQPGDLRIIKIISEVLNNLIEEALEPLNKDDSISYQRWYRHQKYHGPHADLFRKSEEVEKFYQQREKNIDTKKTVSEWKPKEKHESEKE